ncbi:hypothetical protein GCM10029992_55970 [Glycomyces albus]
MLLEQHPEGEARMSANPHANGGQLLRDLVLPDFRDYGVKVQGHGRTTSESTKVLGTWLRDVITANPDRFRLFGPDEVESNRLGEVFEVTDRQYEAELYPTDLNHAPQGRVMEVLSEHLCEGWLEGYLLTGRHGLFTSYEAFIHIVDSMFNQHAKWLETTNDIPWRRPIASLNYLLSSHVWRQDHNGFSHQDPGFIDHVMNKKADVVRVYLPPDTNTLLSTMDHCLRSRQYVNVVVAGKQPALQYTNMDEAVRHCERGLGIWEWASTDDGRSPTWSWPAPGTLRPWRSWRRPTCCVGTCPSCGSGWSTSSTSCASSPTPSTRTDSETGSSTRSSPPTNRSCSPTTATRG